MLTTSTDTLQDPLDGIVAPVSENEDEDAGAFTKPPEQVVEAFGICAIESPLGKALVKAAAVKGAELGLVMAIVNTFGVPAVEFALPVVKLPGLPKSKVLESIAS